MSSSTRRSQAELRRLHEHPRGRLLAITGARQTGKSTLARASFPDHAVIDLDSPHERARWERLEPEAWISRYPRAILDEAQKLPAIFETVKACYDRNPDVRYVLLGSSQILLMDRIRESLAGRIAVRELFPFSLPELLLASSGGATLSESGFVQLLRADRPGEALSELFGPNRSVEVGRQNARAMWEDFLRWGGMPVLRHEGWTDADRFEWLQDYQSTYLQRDLADLARIDRLEPFARLQQAAAMRVSHPVNYSELGRLSGISPPTARHYMRHLEVSYQVLHLPSWFRNPEKRLVKQEKLHFLDPGILRSVLKRTGDPDGFEFENAVVAEVAKQCRTDRLPVSLSYLRTHDGREVDLLIERDDGFFVIECKASLRVDGQDFRHLRDLEDLLDKPILARIVVSRDSDCEPVPGQGAHAWKLEAAALFR